MPVSQFRGNIKGVTSSKNHNGHNLNLFTKKVCRRDKFGSRSQRFANHTLDFNLIYHFNKVTVSFDSVPNISRIGPTVSTPCVYFSRIRK